MGDSERFCEILGDSGRFGAILSWFELRFDALGLKYAPKSTPRNVNFETWDPGRPPGGPQGSSGQSIVDFRGSFLRLFSVPKPIKFRVDFWTRKKVSSERGFSSILVSSGEARPSRNHVYTIQNQRFFIFELVGSQESSWHKKISKMNSK